MRNDSRTLTQAELAAEARNRFGDNPLAYAFRCPSCGDVATIEEFERAGNPAAAGQHCIGRELGALHGEREADQRGVVRGEAQRGCDWTAYGLLPGPWTIVMPNGSEARSFPFAEAS